MVRPGAWGYRASLGRGHPFGVGQEPPSAGTRRTSSIETEKPAGAVNLIADTRE